MDVTVVNESDGMVEGFGEIIRSLYMFAKSISLHLFDIDFTLWDMFIAIVVIGLIAALWHGFTK